MDIDISIKNYRGFSRENPAKFSIRPGFTGFVGANNSGKSTLVRMFHECRPLFDSAAASSGTWGVAQSGNDGLPFPGFRSVADNAEVFCNSNDGPIEISFHLPNTSVEGTVKPSGIKLTVPRNTSKYHIDFEVDGEPPSIANWNTGLSPIVELPGGRQIVGLTRYYEMFRSLSNTLFIGPFRNAVNVGADADYYDLKIGQRFIEHWNSLKAGPNRESNRRAREVLNRLEAVFGFDSLEVQAAPGDKTIHVTVDNEPFQIQELGAGFSQYFMVLSAVAERRPDWTLIDEPELNLHPALQSEFLARLQALSGYGVVFATHSLGLARTISDNAYVVSRKADTHPSVEPLKAAKDCAQMLNEMSFSSFSDLGYEAVLFVEGVTGIPTFQALLRKFEIDHRVVVFPLGGSGLINARVTEYMGDIQRFNVPVWAIIDSERDSERDELSPDRKAFLAGCVDLDITAEVLYRRATENYWTDNAVNAAFGDSFSSLGPFDNLKSSPNGWNKSDNVKIAVEMTMPELMSSDLGEFLERLGSSLSDAAALNGQSTTRDHS